MTITKTRNTTQNNTKSELPPKQNLSFQLKGRLFTLSVLQLQSLNIKELDEDLSEKIKLAPKFFEHAPVVIDVSKINNKTQEQNQESNYSLDFKELKLIIEKHGLIPVGVKGTTKSSHKSAQDAGFAIMTDHSDPSDKTASTDTHKPTSEYRSANSTKQEHKQKHYTKLITDPIRSGQQVYSHGDLVIVSSVSPGAELLAEGNIHVYGTLRGRALAGINGLKSARIFCHQLEAELVSIAGQYKIFEDIQEHNDNTPKQLYLDDTRLVISSL